MKKNIENTKELNEYFYKLEDKIDTAIFDSRGFILPKEEVCNYFIWRQQDATRNAIQMVGQANFSHKQLQGKNCNEIQEMLFQEKGINFNDLPVYQRRGSSIIKENYEIEAFDKKKQCNVLSQRSRWFIDREIPIFTQFRSYIEQYV
jgi:tRNA(His) 5'-end guanylyltransferase